MSTQHNPLFLQKHLTVQELASLWHVDERIIRVLFKDEEGVLVIRNPLSDKRTYKTLRIPLAVAERVHTKYLSGAFNGQALPKAKVRRRPRVRPRLSSNSEPTNQPESDLANASLEGSNGRS